MALTPNADILFNAAGEPITVKSHVSSTVAKEGALVGATRVVVQTHPLFEAADRAGEIRIQSGGNTYFLRISQQSGSVVDLLDVLPVALAQGATVTFVRSVPVPGVTDVAVVTTIAVSFDPSHPLLDSLVNAQSVVKIAQAFGGGGGGGGGIPSAARVIYVDKGGQGEFTEIQAAVDSVLSVDLPVALLADADAAGKFFADNCTVIMIAPGTYDPVAHAGTFNGVTFNCKLILLKALIPSSVVIGDPYSIPVAMTTPRLVNADEVPNDLVFPADAVIFNGNPPGIDILNTFWGMESIFSSARIGLGYHLVKDCIFGGYVTTTNATVLMEGGVITNAKLNGGTTLVRNATFQNILVTNGGDLRTRDCHYAGLLGVKNGSIGFSGDNRISGTLQIEEDGNVSQNGGSLRTSQLYALGEVAEGGFPGISSYGSFDGNLNGYSDSVSECTMTFNGPLIANGVQLNGVGITTGGPAYLAFNGYIKKNTIPVSQSLKIQANHGLHVDGNPVFTGLSLFSVMGGLVVNGTLTFASSDANLFTEPNFIIRGPFNVGNNAYLFKANPGFPPQVFNILPAAPNPGAVELVLAPPGDGVIVISA